MVEVMGRYAGWIALESGLAGTADVILLPIPYDLDKVVAKLQDRHKIRGPLQPGGGGQRSLFRLQGRCRSKSAPVDGNESWAVPPKSCVDLSGRSPTLILATWCWATCCEAGLPAPRTETCPCALGPLRCEPWPKGSTG